jgi:hypothetical protein
MKRIVPLLATLCLLQGAHSQTITSAVPGFISYQGRALNSAGTVMGSGTPVNRTVTFRIWDHASNSLTGNLLYSEQQVVTIAEGEFSVLVGAGAATAGTPLGYSESAKGTPTVKINDPGVFAGANRFLGVTIDDGVVGNTDNEVSPRQQIVASAYALRARYAEQLGSNGGTALTALDSGNVGIGNTNPPARFTVTGANTGTSSANPQLLVTDSADPNKRLRLGVDSTGNGTGFIQSFKEGTGAQNLLLNPNGGNVGIGGTATPAVALSVTGAITATGAITGGSFSTAGGITATGAITGGSLAASGSITGASLATNSGTLGAAAYSELSLGDFGSNVGGNYTRLGISAYRTAATGLWTDTALLLGMNVDDSKRPSGGFISIHGNGNVGIGDGVPGFKLSVAGNAFVSSSLYAWGDLYMASGRRLVNTEGALVLGTITASPTVFQNNNAETMRISATGNVGIGTTAPGAKLQIADGGDDGTNYGSVQIIRHHTGHLGSHLSFIRAASNVMGLGYGQSSSSFGFGPGVATAFSPTHLSIDTAGGVKIGTTSAVGRLNVGAQAAAVVASLGYFNGSGAGALDRPTLSQAVSIYADGTILSYEFNISSDLRIKTDLHASEPVKDLKTLMGIEVTDYHYKDKLARGNGSHKKVIAQQVEKVYPQAVNTTIGVVPDIFKQAAVKDGWIKLATDLKKGDRVRLISEKEEGVHEVLEVKADRFLTEFKPAGDQVFVYGREVNDFRSVDYDAIAMLNVSATQELARQLETVQAENAALRRELVTQEQSMEARLIALERRMSGEGAAKTVSLKTARAAK